jgi:hypothetical protein
MFNVVVSLIGRIDNESHEMIFQLLQLEEERKVKRFEVCRAFSEIHDLRPRENTRDARTKQNASWIHVTATRYDPISRDEFPPSATPPAP